MADGPDNLPSDDDGDDSLDNPFDNPFAALPLFGDLAKALEGQGPLNWDAARQFAMLGATRAPWLLDEVRLAALAEQAKRCMWAPANQHHSEQPG